VTIARRLMDAGIIAAAQHRASATVARRASPHSRVASALPRGASDARRDEAIRGAPERRWANYLEVGRNGLEFLLGFGQLYSEAEQPRVHSRIVTNPVYGKSNAQDPGRVHRAVRRGVRLH
jgi:hypothetical protein